MPSLENRAVDSKREEELPSYTAKKESLGPAGATSSSGLGTEHSFSLKDSKGRAWLTLVVLSRAASDKSLPVFSDEDEINGTVKADAEKPESCKGISISVCILASVALLIGLNKVSLLSDKSRKHCSRARTIAVCRSDHFAVDAFSVIFQTLRLAVLAIFYELA